MNLVNLILIPFACFTWAHQIGIIQKWKWIRKKKSYKPFDCELCLSFWIVLIRETLTTHDITHSFLFAILAGGISNTIYLIYRRLQLI